MSDHIRIFKAWTESDGNPLATWVIERQDARRLFEQLEASQREVARWLTWSDGQYPDESPGDVIHAQEDGTIVLDDGITTWNPLRALRWINDRRCENAERAARAGSYPASRLHALTTDDSQNEPPDLRTDDDFKV